MLRSLAFGVLVIAAVSAQSAKQDRYVYHGCAVFGSGEPGVSMNVSRAPVSRYSATIVANLPGGTLDYGDTQLNEQWNLGTAATRKYDVQSVGGGHKPAFRKALQMPWSDGWTIEALSDRHAHVLLTDSCDDYETYGTQWAGRAGPLKAYSGGRWRLVSTLASQQVGGQVDVTAAGLPMIGMTDTGEDAALPAINHTVQFFLPTGRGLSQWGYVSPATGPSGIADTGCAGSPCAHPLHYGDVLRLSSRFNCNSYPGRTPKGALVCVQLQQYGMIASDQASSIGLRFGAATDGTKGWDYVTDLHPLLMLLHFSDFEVVDIGRSTVRCWPEHRYGSDCF